MPINIKVNRKFIINGKEYHSIDEMPEEIRKAYEKAVAAGGSHVTGSVNVTTKIKFNGQEYAGIEAMPPDVRRTYDEIMKSAFSGNASAGLLARAEHIAGAATAPEGPKPTMFESFSSRRRLIAVLLLLGLLGLFFALLRR